MKPTSECQSVCPASLSTLKLWMNPWRVLLKIDKILFAVNAINENEQEDTLSCMLLLTSNGLYFILISFFSQRITFKWNRIENFICWIIRWSSGDLTTLYCLFF